MVHQLFYIFTLFSGYFEVVVKQIVLRGHRVLFLGFISWGYRLTLLDNRGCHVSKLLARSLEKVTCIIGGIRDNLMTQTVTHVQHDHSIIFNFPITAQAVRTLLLGSCDSSKMIAGFSIWNPSELVWLNNCLKRQLYRLVRCMDLNSKVFVFLCHSSTIIFFWVAGHMFIVCTLLNLN